MNGLAK